MVFWVESGRLTDDEIRAKFHNMDFRTQLMGPATLLSEQHLQV